MGLESSSVKNTVGEAVDNTEIIPHYVFTPPRGRFASAATPPCPASGFKIGWLVGGAEAAWCSNHTNPLVVEGSYGANWGDFYPTTGVEYHNP